jgi:hypothetical protein
MDKKSALKTEPTHYRSPRRDAMKKSLRYALFGLGTIAAAGLETLLPRTAHAGAGRCYKCNCPAFEGSTYQCANCGHQYGDHW